MSILDNGDSLIRLVQEWYNSEYLGRNGFVGIDTCCGQAFL